MGAQYMFDDDQETPNTMVVAYEFEVNGKKKLMTFEVRHWMTNDEADIRVFDTGVKSNTVGNIFYGSNGYLAIDRYTKYDSYPGKEAEPGSARKDGGDHFANFLSAMRTRSRGY